MRRDMLVKTSLMKRSQRKPSTRVRASRRPIRSRAAELVIGDDDDDAPADDDDRRRHCHHLLLSELGGSPAAAAASASSLLLLVFEVVLVVSFARGNRTVSRGNRHFHLHCGNEKLMGFLHKDEDRELVDPFIRGSSTSSSCISRRTSS